MQLTKRELLALGAGSLAAVALTSLPAFAEGEKAAARLKEFAGGKEPAMAKVSLTTPEIAENGNTVPVSVTVESPMTEASYVQSVMLLADGNPEPGVATFHFTPWSGEASATTRIRLAKTQNVLAIARMSDGSVYMDKKLVKVTIGGCGG